MPGRLFGEGDHSAFIGLWLALQQAKVLVEFWRDVEKDPERTHEAKGRHRISGRIVIAGRVRG